MNGNFERKLWISTVPLVSTNVRGLPTGIASGCFVRYGEKNCFYPSSMQLEMVKCGLFSNSMFLIEVQNYTG